MSRRPLALWPYALLILLALLVLARLAFSDMILARGDGDVFAYFYPYWEARSAAFREGILPLWTPDLFMGAPLLANPQIGTFYPPNWLVTPLSAPDAIKLSLIVHVAWAALGVFALFRRQGGGIVPGLVAAALFAFGGDLGGHTEQINQLQGIAWLPWLLLLYDHMADTALPWRARLFWGMLLAAAWALQLFSGHTQTVFMSGVALALWGLLRLPRPGIRPLLNWLLPLAAVTLAVIALSLPQLLPTLELTGLSNRGGGFSVQAATAFSLPPHYLPRALLPSYDGLLFTEYLGYVGVVGLGLALMGALLPGVPRRWRWLGLVFALVGLGFALGRFNPLYWLLVELPGFNLFRVPARWLTLFTLGTALLAGWGLDALQRGQRLATWQLGGILALLTGLMLGARYIPVDPADVLGLAVPTALTLAAWLAGLVGVLLLVGLASRTDLRRRVAERVNRPAPFNPVPPLALTLVLVELLLASQVLPYNDLAPREVALRPRFTTNQLQVYQADQTPPARLLSISERNFDPGDVATLTARYTRLGLDEIALRHALVAIKKQELLAPNLPLTWGVPSVDGFGGGLLPTLTYTQLTALLLPPGTSDAERAIDGRLGERLAQPECRGACIPPLHLLQLMDVGYLITDKVYDIWREGVAYDTALPQPLIDMTLAVDPAFQATEARLLLSEGGALDAAVLRLNAGAEALPLSAARSETFDGFTLATLAFPQPVTLSQLTLSANMPEATLHALTLVDARTGDFWQVPLGGWERALSSDIKLYRQPNPLGRAMLAREVRVLPDSWQGSEDALAIMRQPDYDPVAISIVHGGEPLAQPVAGGTVTITEYSPTKITLEAESSAETYLLLRDAHYPGWLATVNGEPAPLYRADILFRAVPVPEGRSTVVMRFEPELWRGSLLAGLVAWALLIGGLLGYGLVGRRQQS